MRPDADSDVSKKIFLPRAPVAESCGPVSVKSAEDALTGVEVRSYRPNPADTRTTAAMANRQGRDGPFTIEDRRADGLERRIAGNAHTTNGTEDSPSDSPFGGRERRWPGWVKAVSRGVVFHQGKPYLAIFIRPRNRETALVLRLVVRLEDL